MVHPWVCRRRLLTLRHSWKPIIEHLMDVTVIQGGHIKTSLSNSERTNIKDRFKARLLSLAFTFADTTRAPSLTSGARVPRASMTTLKISARRSAVTLCPTWTCATR